MALEHDSDSALAKAVRKAGSQSAFGRMIGKRQSVIHDWLRECRPLPAELVRTVEELTGISRHDLRPDIYPVEDHQTPVPPTVAAPTAGSSRFPAVGVSCSDDSASVARA